MVFITNWYKSSKSNNANNDCVSDTGNNLGVSDCNTALANQYWRAIVDSKSAQIPFKNPSIKYIPSVSFYDKYFNSNNNLLWILISLIIILVLFNIYCIYKNYFKRNNVKTTKYKQVNINSDTEDYQSDAI